MIPADLIERARSRDILEVAEQLGARLKRASTVERNGPCPRCGGDDRFWVNIRKRIWGCRGCGVDGDDIIALVQHVDGVSFPDAIERLTGETGKLVRTARPVQRQANDADDNLDRAADIWNNAGPLGEEARAYFAKRCIDIDAVPDLGGLRWHPRCPWGSGGATAPCIVARFTNAITGDPRGVWRRRIDEPAKPIMLGPTRGCVIRLWPDDEVTTGLVIGEGVETVLAAATRIEHLGTLLQPAWACGGTGNLQTFPALAGIEALTILVDRDEKGGGQRAAAVCAQRWCDAKREVISLTPTQPGDFNDIVRGEP